MLGMTACVMAFGALSLDLARPLLVNARFLAEHGWEAALRQRLSRRRDG